MRILETFRHRLSTVDAVPQLAIMGIATGLLTGVVIIAFRYLIESSQSGFLPGGDVENYEGLPWWARLALPIIGAVVIALVWTKVDRNERQVGVVHVLERLAYNQAYLPAKNFVLQFIGASVSIISGHSVGREGPGIHLGAASGSLLGQVLHLPNNVLRVLVACGAAASIAASFNTPIAGVIFAMEVIVMEYSIAGFTPVILASVSATVLTRFVFGDTPAFTVPTLQLSGLWEMPVIVALGLAIGALAAGFNWLMRTVSVSSQQYSYWLRLIVAGAITGIAAVAVPQIMGIGYDTVNASLTGQMAIWLLLLIVVAKLLVTATGLGLGLPGGLIGPTIVIGAAAGGIFGLIVGGLFEGNVASTGFYALLGMGAMMAAVLQAPLAALMAMLELTGNMHIILPGMLAVVIASMTSRHLFRCESIFLMMLKTRGLNYFNNPVTEALRRTGAQSVMNPSILLVDRTINVTTMGEKLAQKPQWLIVEKNSTEMPILMRPADVAVAMTALQQDDALDLLEIPAERIQCPRVNSRATLQEALDIMIETQINTVCITQIRGRKNSITQNIIGIVSRDMIESYYQYP